MAKKKDQKNAPQSDKWKSVRAAVAGIDKVYGAGSMRRLGDEAIEKIEVTSTGILTLDIALGVGGIPKGRIIEFYGPESAGKTMCALYCAAKEQQAGGIVALVDAEQSFDPSFAQIIGVDVENLLHSQPGCGEEALEQVDMLLKSGGVDLIIVDSVAALIPKAELEGEMGESKMGLHARLMSQAMRKLAGIINKSNCSVIFINQLRDKIGIMFGSPETTTGGNALKFYSSIRLDVRKSGQIKVPGETKGKEIVLGHHVKVKVIKNKVATPFKVAEFDLIYGQGVNQIGMLLDIAEQYEIVERSGAWYAYNDTKIGQGKEDAINTLKDNTELCDEIESKIRTMLNI